MPGPGRKEISKLVPVKIIDKLGRRTTVYVKPEDFSTGGQDEGEEYYGDPQYQAGEDLTKDKYYPLLTLFLMTHKNKNYAFRLDTDHATMVKHLKRLGASTDSIDINIPLGLTFRDKVKGDINMKAMLKISSRIREAEGEEKGKFFASPLSARIYFPDDSNVFSEDFYNKYANKKEIQKVVESKIGKDKSDEEDLIQQYIESFGSSFDISVSSDDRYTFHNTITKFISTSEQEGK